MLYTVEIRLMNGKLGEPLAAMRTWLDQQGFEPSSFRYSTGGTGITFRVDFKIESEAVALAETFNGQILQAVAGVGAPSREVAD